MLETNKGVRVWVWVGVGDVREGLEREGGEKEVAVRRKMERLENKGELGRRAKKMNALVEEETYVFSTLLLLANENEFLQSQEIRKSLHPYGLSVE